MELREAYVLMKLLNEGGGGEPAVIESLSVNENGVYEAPEGVDGYSPVSVSVPASAVVSGTLNVTNNGTVDVTEYASAQVNVPASEVDSGTKNITTNGTHDVVGYANAIVSVPASAVVSGTLNITENGNYDVTDYAGANVNVSGGGGDVWDEINERTWNGNIVFTGTSVRDFLMKMSSPAFTVKGDSVTNIGQQAFQSTGVVSVSLPALKSIGGYAFAGCQSLTSFYGPSVTTIGGSAFSQCYKLGSLDFPALTSIGASAFYQCSSASTLSMPLLKRIDNGAFFSCLGLTSVNFPALSYCGSTAFMNCNHLETFIAGQSASSTTLYSGVFRGCSLLESVYLLGESKVSIQNSIVFSDTAIATSSYLGRFGSVYVPAVLLDDYKSYGAWSYYSSRLVGLTSVEIAALSI